MLCAHTVYLDMSQLIVLLAFRNISDLKKLQTFIFFVTNYSGLTLSLAICIVAICY